MTNAQKNHLNRGRKLPERTREVSSQGTKNSVANVAKINPQAPLLPRALRVHPRKVERSPLLAQEVHALALAAQRLRHRGGVHVRSGAAEQVAVEHQEVHAAAQRTRSRLLHLSRRPGRLGSWAGVSTFTAVVIVDADARRRRALRDVIGGLAEVDAVTEVGTAFEAARPPATPA